MWVSVEQDPGESRGKGPRVLSVTWILHVTEEPLWHSRAAAPAPLSRAKTDSAGRCAVYQKPSGVCSGVQGKRGCGRGLAGGPEQRKRRGEQSPKGLEGLLGIRLVSEERGSVEPRVARAPRAERRREGPSSDLRTGPPRPVPGARLAFPVRHKRLLA